MSRPKPNRGQARPPKYRCSVCGHLGHNSQVCVKLPAGERKMRDYYARIARNELEPPKNHPLWERLRTTREGIRLSLEQALGDLSDRSPAYRHIKHAVKLLEDVKEA